MKLMPESWAWRSKRIDAVLLKVADGLPYAAATAERHGAEAEFGDEEAGAAELVVFH